MHRCAIYIYSYSYWHFINFKLVYCFHAKILKSNNARFSYGF